VHPRRTARILGFFALLLAVWWQFGMAIGTGFAVADPGYLEFRWIPLLVIAGLPVVLVGYLACLVGSRPALRLATACDMILALIAVAAAAGIAAMTSESIIVALYGLPLVALLLAVPAGLLMAGILRMKSITAEPPIPVG
jgi:hypothetical protein